MSKEIISHEGIINNAGLIFRADFYPIYTERYGLGLSSDEKLILSFIHYRTKNGQWIYVTNSQIAMLIESSESTAKRCLKYLRDRGFILIEEKRTQTGTDRRLKFNKVLSQSLAQTKNELSAQVKLTCPQGSNGPTEKNNIEKNNIDISKDISADAKNTTQHIQESKLDNTDTEQTNTHNTPTSLETNEVERNADLTITAEDIFNAYKGNTQRKGTLDDLKKVVRGKSYEELKAILLEMRLFTFEYRLKLTSSETKNGKKIDYSNSCAHLAEKPDTDEESIISRVESIVNAFKTHKNKNEKIRNEWKREIEEYFKDYIGYIGNTANMTKEERRAEFDKYASVGQMSKFKELYPTADIRAIKEDWLLRCAQGRR